MCILLVSTQHPDYPLILLSNRDEFLHRPTARAAWWDTPATSHILSGRDLARPERGTWLGITRQGRIAVLTNYREASLAAAIGARSRGAMVNAFLTSPVDGLESTRDWVQRMLTADGDEGVKGVGGFSLLCGTIRPRRDKPGSRLAKPVDLDPLAIISNRTPSKEEAHWICGKHGEVHGLSNSLFDDPMEKVVLGEDLLRRTLDEAISTNAPEDELLEKLFSVLSHDTLPIIKGEHTYEAGLETLSHSIFIPAFEAPEETPQKQPTTTPADTAPTPLQREAAESTIESTNANGTVPIPNGTSTSVNQQNGQLTPPEPVSTPTPENVAPGNKRPHNLGNIIATTSSNCYCPTPATPASLSTPFNSPQIYGTQKQTIILVNNDGHVKYVERTLYDGNARWVGEDGNRDIVFEFDIEGWS